jgi:hypothetical protein
LLPSSLALAIRVVEGEKELNVGEGRTVTDTDVLAVASRSVGLDEELPQMLEEGDALGLSEREEEELVERLKEGEAERLTLTQLVALAVCNRLSEMEAETCALEEIWADMQWLRVGVKDGSEVEEKVTETLKDTINEGDIESERVPLVERSNDGEAVKDCEGRGELDNDRKGVTVTRLDRVALAREETLPLADSDAVEDALLQADVLGDCVKGCVACGDEVAVSVAKTEPEGEVDVLGEGELLREGSEEALGVLKSELESVLEPLTLSVTVTLTERVDAKLLEPWREVLDEPLSVSDGVRVVDSEELPLSEIFMVRDAVLEADTVTHALALTVRELAADKEAEAELVEATEGVLEPLPDMHKEGRLDGVAVRLVRGELLGDNDERKDAEEDIVPTLAVEEMEAVNVTSVDFVPEGEEEADAQPE